MKKVMVAAIFLFSSIGIFAQANTDKLPKAAQDYISQHFASISIDKVEENSNWQIWEDDKYEVKLSNGIELDFDENGNIVEIESKNNVSIPEGALPSNVATYLRTNYAGIGIKSWEKDSKGQEVELVDGTELEFDKDGKFQKID